MDPLVLGVAAIAPHFLHVDPLAVFLHRVRVSLEIHIHGVQPGPDEQIQRLLGHVAVGDVGVVQSPLAGQAEHIQ